ncbi:thiol S-methyltransferase TMT1B-like [Dermacentor andersoni]|uniref:thiol S-methyltransferase TMT1B-like n=1 Tax=Dermacentor andersoni TaxID=34620 RepID=UPI00215505C0|nr:thiol S-methyltransferase METTL7B-like [Dermacentor andersoni]
MRPGRHSRHILRIRLQRWTHFVLNYALLAAVGVGGMFLLPALMASHRFSEVSFAFIYTLIQRFMKNDMAVVRRGVVSLLDDMVSHDVCLKARGAVRLLEVGAAYGPNLEFIGRSVEYWTLEPNGNFEAALQRNLKENPKVEMKRVIHGYGEDMGMLPDEHFDAVLITFVLCTAKDGSKLLSECKRVLAKDGCLLFAEHVGHKKGTFARFLQDIMTPYTKNLAGGCHLNRDTETLLRKAGFSKVTVHTIDLDIPVVLSRTIYGIAIV